MLSVGIFLRDPSPYLREFRRKTTENTERRQSRSRIESGTSRLHFLEQVGLSTDSLTSMPYLGFEPGTLGVLTSSPNHYTAWSAEMHRYYYTGYCSGRVAKNGIYQRSAFSVIKFGNLLEWSKQLSNFSEIKIKISISYKTVLNDPVCISLKQWVFIQYEYLLEQ